MAELPTINLALYALTDVGMVRSGNEDNFLILDLSTAKSWVANEEESEELLTYKQGYYGTLLAVSDGMGGALAGEVASRMAVETVRDRMLQLQAHKVYGKISFSERLRLSIEEANLLINSESQTNPAHKGLGATFTAVATQGDHIYFAQVGDSRAYLIRNGDITRVTKDQSLVQQLIDAGQITEEEAETHSYRNVILQALGAHNNVNVEVNCLTLCQLDTLVICSDGLSGKMHQDEIARIVNEASDFKTACQSLVYLANERGGEDNITVIIAQFSGSGIPEPDDFAAEPESLPRSPDTPTEIDWEAEDPDSFDLPPPSNDLPPMISEPHSSPPADSAPFAATAQRNSSDAPRTSDLSDRLSPITSVFAAGEFEEDPYLAATQTTAQVAASIEQRQAQALAGLPVHPAGSENRARSAMSSNYNRVGAARPPRVKNQSMNPNTWLNFFIYTCLLMILVMLLVFGVASYFKRKELEQLARKDAEIQRQFEERLDRVSQLRERIAEVNRKLEATDIPEIQEKLIPWQDKLKELGYQLDEVISIPPDRPLEIEQACDRIGKELRQIEDEVNNLQGFFPAQTINRLPVKV